MNSITASAFTSALSQAANGVSVVTTSDGKQRAGLTVSSMCSVCAEPALVLVCVNPDNEFCVQANANKHFAINILNSEQQNLGMVFAGLTEDENADRFQTGTWSNLTTGSPILKDALVALDCRLESSTLKGTHNIYFGQVVDVRTTGGEPLLYTDRSFATALRIP